MNRFFVKLAAVILAAGLVLAGCPDGTPEGGNDKYITISGTPKRGETLTAALTGLSESEYEVRWTTVDSLDSTDYDRAFGPVSKTYEVDDYDVGRYILAMADPILHIGDVYKPPYYSNRLGPVEQVPYNIKPVAECEFGGLCSENVWSKYNALISAISLACGVDCQGNVIYFCRTRHHAKTHH
jgi:hypothetical protein